MHIGGSPGRDRDALRDQRLRGELRIGDGQGERDPGRVTRKRAKGPLGLRRQLGLRGGVRIDEAVLNFTFDIQGDWVLPKTVEARWAGELLMLKDIGSTLSFRLDETDPAHEQAYARAHADHSPLTDISDAWARRDEAHFHEIANWATGQFYNPFKDGGVLSMTSPLVDLENFHRTDFTAEELAVDASDLENASYWLLTNQDLQPQILDLIPALQEAYAEIPAGETAATYRPFFDAAEPINALLTQLQPETKEAIAEDVTAFFAWSSDINLNSRKQTGLYVVLLLAILSVLLYFYYREIAKQEFAKQSKEGGPWDDNH